MAFTPERYREVVPDFPAFAEAVRRPLPVTVWANPLRTTPEEARAWLEAEGLSPEPVAWRPGAFRLPPDAAPGRLLATVAGLIHVQEEVSLLPVALLDPRPGERVLDLCAAPGGKAAQIAVALGNRGTLVANDADWRRLSSLGRNLERMGAVNAVLTCADAASFPEAGAPFDRVLADVPCTCEGTSRKNPEVFTWGDAGERRDIARLQRAILRKAVRLCRPGGRIVYSTCTYAPEENEAVVAAALEEAGPDRLRLLEARVEGLRADPGLAAWRGERFPPELSRALRVWPHANDTGGFFVAVLERGGGGEEAPREPAIADLPEVDPEPWLGPVRERFGLPEETFAGLRLVRRGKEGLAVVPRDLRPPARPAAQAAGLSFLHAGMRNPKLTTAAAMAFGAAATRNAVELDREEVGAYFARRDQELPAARTGTCTGPGYAVVRHRGVALGLGWVRPAAGGAPASLQSLFPKRW
jgi:NOL1/NOP2/sun family putative RNA methylase